MCKNAHFHNSQATYARDVGTPSRKRGEAVSTARTGSYASTFRGMLDYLNAVSLWAHEQVETCSKTGAGRLDNTTSPKIRLRFERNGEVVYREYNPLLTVWRKLQADTARKNRDILPDVAALAFSYFMESIRSGTDETGCYVTPFTYRVRFGHKNTLYRCSKCQTRGVHTVVDEFHRCCPAKHGKHTCGHTSHDWKEIRYDEDDEPHLCCNDCGKVVDDVDSSCSNCDNHSDAWKVAFNTVSGQEPASCTTLQELFLRCLKYSCQHMLRENRGSVDVNSVAEGTYVAVHNVEFLDSMRAVVENMTQREKDIAKLRHTGLNINLIARTLHMSATTVSASIKRVQTLMLTE